MLARFTILIFFFAAVNGSDIDGDEVDEPFIPTHEWQRVKPDQVIPSGLHVRMDMTNGGKWAKLMDENDKNTGIQIVDQPEPSTESENKEKQNTFSIKDVKHALKKMKQENKATQQSKDEVSKKFKSMDEIRKGFDSLNIQEESDVEAMKRLVGTLRLKTTSKDAKLYALQDLEYYVHQIDNAVDLFNIDAFGEILSLLNNTDPEIREEAAHVIGSALQSNPKAQVKGLEIGTMPVLLRLLADKQQPMPVRKKSMYALSALTRHFPHAQLKLADGGGFMVFKNIFDEDGSDQLKVKVVRLMYDLFDERKMAKENDSKESDERQRQYERLDLPKQIAEYDLCSGIKNSLALPTHASRESTLQAMKSLFSICANEFASKSSLQNLKKLKVEYEGLEVQEKKEGENEGYFALLNKLVQDVENLIKNNLPLQKVEL